MLNQCSLNIQKKTNRLNARVIYIKNNLYKARSEVYNSYKTYGGYDIVLGKACQEYAHINDLNNMYLMAQIELEDIKFLSKHVEAMAKNINGMAFKNMGNN